MRGYIGRADGSMPLGTGGPATLCRGCAGLGNRCGPLSPRRTPHLGTASSAWRGTRIDLPRVITERRGCPDRFRDPVAAAYDVVVVGAGHGGLGRGARSARAPARRVLVLDGHYVAGGNATRLSAPALRVRRRHPLPRRLPAGGTDPAHPRPPAGARGTFPAHGRGPRAADLSRFRVRHPARSASSSRPAPRPLPVGQRRHPALLSIPATGGAGHDGQATGSRWRQLAALRAGAAGAAVRHGASATCSTPAPGIRTCARS